MQILLKFDFCFFRQGGSGKSFPSRPVALHCALQSSVLAVDADHNMDLSYNLCGGTLPTLSYFSHSLPALQQATGLQDSEKCSEAFLRQTTTRFTPTPLSSEIAEYSTELKNGIRLMTAGPQTDTVLYGQSCSHSLTTPLKILLPLLALPDNALVIVDEKAGADGASAGPWMDCVHDRDPVAGRGPLGNLLDAKDGHCTRWRQRRLRISPPHVERRTDNGLRGHREDCPLDHLVFVLERAATGPRPGGGRAPGPETLSRARRAPTGCSVSRSSSVTCQFVSKVRLEDHRSQLRH